MTNVGTPISRPRVISTSACASSARGLQELAFARAGLGLHLAHPVEVAHVHGDALAVSDDDVPRDELDQVADRRAERAELLARSRAVMPVAAQALERDEHAAVVGLEAVGSRERCRSRELAQHLAVARAADVDLVEEGRDRRVVAPE